jgi:hypothetical protein
MIQFLAIAGVAAALITPGTDPALAPSEKVTLDIVTVNGSGCPAGTTAVAVAPDNTAFTVTYSDYLAQVGVGAKATDTRKNCQLAVQVNIPSGFTFAIAQADYRGYASLARGATGMQRASYYFQGESATQASTHRLPVGPFDDNWQATDTTEMAEMVYAPCGAKRYLNINTELRVGAGFSDTNRTTSFMTMDSTDADVSTVYHFSWMRC